MKYHKIIFVCVGITCVSILATAVLVAGPRLVNYQGRLTNSGGEPISGSVALKFTIYDASAAGNQKWTETQGTVTVSNGLFNVLLGSVNAIHDSVFNNQDRYLGIQVGADPEISPRTRLVTVPWSYRVHTVDGSAGGVIYGDVNVTGSARVGLGNSISGTYGFASGFGNSISGNYGFVAGQLNQVTGNNAKVGGGSYNHANGDYSVVGGGGGAGAVYGNTAGGKMSTIGGGQGNETSGDASTIGGGLNNSAGATGVVGGGGGNAATGNASTVAGGYQNTASSDVAAIGGGNQNTASGQYATVAGGRNNHALGSGGVVAGGFYDTAGTYCSVGGGFHNVASNVNSTIGGGSENVASGIAVVIAGGDSNVVSGDYSSIGGGFHNKIQWGNNVIGGGSRNRIDGAGCFIGAGYEHTFAEPPANPDHGANYVRGDLSSIVGGTDNYIEGESYNSILGGLHNAILSGNGSWIGGGLRNKIEGIPGDAPNYSAICSGESNKMTGSYSFCGAGFDNDVFADASAIITGGYLTAYDMGSDQWVFKNQIDSSATYSFIGTGWGNHACDSFSLILGGVHNYARGKFSIVVGGGADFDPLAGPFVTVDSNSASGDWSAILGGKGHVAGGLASAVGGGSYNRANGDYSVISGGGGSDVSFANAASGTGSTVGGGASNSAIGAYSTIPGGFDCMASGQYATALGRTANAVHNGSLVWSDAAGAPFSSSAANQFSLRAAGGTRIYSNATATLGVQLNPGSGTWTSISDSTLKRNIREVDYEAILNKVAELPISRWSYISQDDSIEHIGPMGQDFYRLFDVGDNNTTISAVDPDGIALAAIKALYEKSKRVDELESEVVELRRLVEALIANRH